MARPLVSWLVCGLFVLAYAPQARADEPPTPPGTQAEGFSLDETPVIYGGTPANTCGWPTTVFLGGCTGTLVHPRVVIYAAHCGTNVSAVGFGERNTALQRTVSTQFCKRNPAYTGVGNGRDQAFCVLSQPQEDIPIVPILMGCETGVLKPGREVVIVGFGQADATPSFGVKREVTTTINSITANQEAFIGGGGKDSCQGDSGGPVYVKLPAAEGADDTWRVFGITSYGGACGSGGYYSMMHPAMPWFDSELAPLGIDLTPCHDAAGTWQPTPACGYFPLDPASGAGTSWANGCAGGPVSGPSSLCGPGFNSEPDEDPPTVIITSPAAYATIPATGDLTAVTIAAQIDDGDGWGVARAELFMGPDLLATKFSGPYEWTGDFPVGVYTMRVVGTDHAGNAAEASVTFGVGVDPPIPEPEPEPDGDGVGEGGGLDGGDFGADGSGGGGDGCGCSTRGGGQPAMGLLALGLLGLLSSTRRRRAQPGPT